jgi:hypothetical protein
MQYRVWRSGREIVSYEEDGLRCEFNCTYEDSRQPQVLYLHDRCHVSGQERKLTQDELARIETRVRNALTERRLFGFKFGTRELQVVREQTL